MYKVFAWDTYYPLGGLNDLKYEADTVELCWQWLVKNHFDHYQIVDSQFHVVLEG